MLIVIMVLIIDGPRWALCALCPSSSQQIVGGKKEKRKKKKKEILKEGHCYEMTSPASRVAFIS